MDVGGTTVKAWDILTLRFWIEFQKQTDYLQAVHAAILGIKESFDRNGISIPFPIRTLDLGGLGLEDMVKKYLNSQPPRP